MFIKVKGSYKGPYCPPEDSLRVHLKTDALISIVHPKQRGRVISGNDELQGGVTAQVVARAVAARALAARARAEAAAGDCVTDDGALYTRVQEGPTRRWVAGRNIRTRARSFSLRESRPCKPHVDM